jgi:hypothetical protein
MYVSNKHDMVLKKTLDLQNTLFFGLVCMAYQLKLHLTKYSKCNIQFELI